MLGFPVRVGGSAGRKILPDGHTRRFPVNGCGRTEHNGLDPVRLHGSTQIQRTGDVIVIIPQRLVNRFSDGFQAGKMNAAVNLRVFIKHAVKRLPIQKIHTVKAKIFSRNLPDAVKHDRMTVTEIINNNQLIAFVE